MRAMFWRWLAALCGLGLSLVMADAQAMPPVVTPKGLDAAALIKRVQDSGLRHSFIGTFVVSSSGQLSSSRITHFCDGQNQIERIETLDGQMRQIFRHNDAVHVLWPRTRQASIEQREVVRDFPSALSAEGAGALDQYEIQAGADDERVADHAAQVVLLKPRDSYRFAQRWWLERDSGLLLRADVLGEHGEVLESAAFSSLQIGVRIQPQLLLQEMNRLDGYKVSRTVLERTDLEREGWNLRVPVAGFRPVSVVRRPGNPALRSAAPVGLGAAPSAETETMLQAIYSDGLTHVSIFIEPYQLETGRSEAVITSGATHAVTRRQGDWWITAVGDVPASALRQFTQALERRKP